MKEVVMKVDDEFWDHITQLTVFKEQKEITHCKDCIWWTKKTIYRHDKVEDEYWTCGRYEPIDPDDGEEMTEDDFCSRGERK